MKNCPYCGTELIKTNWDNNWCPNHGKIEETKEGDEESYIR